MANLRHRTPFVGRMDELRRLREHLTVAGSGEGSIVLVAGEPGIGKSRLLAELAEQARGEGWQVLFGRAYESDATVPYVLFVEAVRDFLRHDTSEHRQNPLGRRAAALTRLVPELHDGLRSRPEHPTGNAEGERYRLFADLSDALLALARLPGSPGLLLLLDDLQWADRTSLLLLQHLTRRLHGQPVLVVGTYRSVDVSPSHPIAELLAELSREGMMQRIPLGRLSPEESMLLVTQLAGTPPTAAIVDAIYRQTEGNPLFLREVVRHLVTEGHNLADPLATASDWRIPESVRHVIGGRLSRLSDAALQVLQAAAVIDAHVRFDVLVGSCALGEASALDAVEEAVRAGMLREAAGGYEFTHPLIRQTVYEALSLPRRQRLHLRVARALEQVYGRRLEAQVPALAVHYRLAGPQADPAQAVAYSLQAGATARAVFAYEAAATHWRAALELMDEHGEEDEVLAGLLEQLGEVYVIGIDAAAGIACYERGLALYQRLEQQDAVVRLHLRLADALAPLPEAMGTHPAPDVDRALGHYRAAETLMAGAPESATLGRLYAGMAAAALFAARIRDGLASSRRALEIAERTEDEGLWAAAAFVHGVCVADTGNVSDGLALWQRAWETADRLDDPVTAFVAACARGGQAVYMRDPREAQAWFQRELATPRLARSPLQRRALLRQLAQAHVFGGELAEARRLLAEAGEDEFVGPLLAFWRGDWESAGKGWAEGRERARRVGNRWLLWLTDHYLARLHEVQGEPGEAEPLLVEALAIGVEGGDLLVELVVRPHLALIYAGMGQPHHAEPHLARAREILAAGQDWRGLPGRVALADAASAVGTGSPDMAEDAFERAVAVFRRYALPWDEAEALEWWGDTLLATGQRVRGHDMLDRAADIYRKHGAGRPWLDRLQAVRTRPSRASSGGRPLSAYPAGLSEREVEVLRLLAAGKSNAEIAAALVISRHTVIRHVDHILAKLGASNRTEAAAYAHRNGLA